MSSMFRWWQGNAIRRRGDEGCVVPEAWKSPSEATQAHHFAHFVVECWLISLKIALRPRILISPIPTPNSHPPPTQFKLVEAPPKFARAFLRLLQVSPLARATMNMHPSIFPLNRRMKYPRCMPDASAMHKRNGTRYPIY